MKVFSHLDEDGNVKMVDVTEKVSTVRIAKAEGKIIMLPETITAITDDAVPKGNVLTTAKIAGIQAAKKTSELIPLCHQLNLSWIDLGFDIEENGIGISSIVKTREATGVEMEALTAVFTAALTIYDMCKAIDSSMEILCVKLISKSGGRSQHMTDFRPKVGVITLSDSVDAGKIEDISGTLLKEGFGADDCTVEHYKVLPDGSVELETTICEWINDGVELIVTTGGTGLGPRDLTLSIVEPMFDSRLSGIEQALHARGRSSTSTAMLSQLAAGVVDGAIIICVPGSPGAVKDALIVLIPSIYHAFHILKGGGH